MKKIILIFSMLFIITAVGCEDDNSNNPTIIPVEDISLKPTLNLMLDNDSSYQFVPEITPANATNKNVTWSTSDDSIADVSEEGLVTPVGEGEATITATSDDGGFEDECLVTVYEPVILAIAVLLNKSKILLPIGSDEQLIANVEPSDATNKDVTWTTNDKDVATVSHDGLVTAVGAGEATITATSVEDANIKADCRVTVVWKTFQGDYTITNEDDLNKLINYSVITGNLKIEKTSLTNLDGLSNLTSVGGDLYIGYNAALPNLAGLSNITSVGGGLNICFNTVLTNLAGLSNITSVGGGLNIGFNPVLTNLAGLSSITSVGGGLSIGFNPVLTNLAGLSNITSVGGDLYIGYNAALTNLADLNNITSVGGDLYIGYNAALANLAGLSNIISVGGGLSIDYNDVLPTCEAENFLTQLIEYSGTTTIAGNNDSGSCN